MLVPMAGAAGFFSWRKSTAHDAAKEADGSI